MKRKVILITVDSLRADCVGPQRGESLTPQIDAWAAKGIRFGQAIANGPLTSASFPAILRSRHGSHGGDTSSLSLAGILASHGYRTGAFVAANPYVSGLAGYAAGFEVFKDWMGEGGAHITQTFKGIAGTGGLFRKMLGWRRLPALQFLNGLRGNRRRPFPAGDVVTNEATSWARGVNGPFFLWVHLMDLHYPYLAQHREDGVSKAMFVIALLATLLGMRSVTARVMRRLYEQRVRDVDQMVGRLVRELGDDAVVIFTADHGEQFGERGRFAHPASLFDEQLRVPLAVTGTGVTPCECNGQFALIDLAPTLLGLLGLPAAAAFEGRDHSAALHKQGQGVLSDVVISEAVHFGHGLVPDHLSGATTQADGKLYRTFSARTPDWKYVIDEEGPRELLFDLRQDPGELCNVIGLQPAEAARMRACVASHRALAQTAAADGRPALTPEEEQLMKKQLEDLGYL